jgi:hypothetical protein
MGSAEALGHFAAGLDVEYEPVAIMHVGPVAAISFVGAKSARIQAVPFDIDVIQVPGIVVSRRFPATNDFTPETHPENAIGAGGGDDETLPIPNQVMGIRQFIHAQIMRNTAAVVNQDFTRAGRERSPEQASQSILEKRKTRGADTINGFQAGAVEKTQASSGVFVAAAANQQDTVGRARYSDGKGIHNSDERVDVPIPEADRSFLVPELNASG